MADILKITTPMVNKNSVQPNKQATDPTVPFNVSDVSKVIQPHSESEILSQNNGLLKQDAPAILMDMLKDPSITVGFLSNILLIEDIVKLLPINNSPVTQEIEHLFNSMLINSEQIAQELLRQEKSSTAFKGELFDFLRNLLIQKKSPTLEKSVITLLKSIHSYITKDDILDTLGNNLSFLANSFAPSKNLSQKFRNLSILFKQPDAKEHFPQLKNALMELLAEAEQSILLTPKVSKALPLVIYNLSRFNDNPDFIRNASSDLMLRLDTREQKQMLSQLLTKFISMYSSSGKKGSGSGIMDTIASIIKVDQDTGGQIITPDSTEKIIHSLLSSPCNFTPLLHYVVPVEFMGAKAFAEIWLDPDNGQESGESAQSQNHMLMVFEIEGIGSFEAELFVVGKKLTLSILCPERYLNEFKVLTAKLPNIINANGYVADEVRVDSLQSPRSLMDVFKDLPYKRTGIDVKI